MATMLRHPVTACADCAGTGRVHNPAVSAATFAVTGVRVAVRRSCPRCGGSRTGRP